MLAVTSIVKNREWILPFFLQCIHNIAYPRESTAIILYNDASTDNSLALMQEFQQKYAHEYHAIRIINSTEVFDNNTSSRDPKQRDRLALYHHLTKLRNIVIDNVIDLGCEWQFSVDSDILFSPDIVMELMRHNLPYVATLIINDNFGLNYFNYTFLHNRHVNFGMLETDENGERTYVNYPYQLNRLYSVDVSGACYLINKETIYSGARFMFDWVGEDVGYCLQLKEKGIQVSVDTTWRAVHVMEKKYFQQALPVFNRLMTIPLIRQENLVASQIPEESAEVMSKHMLPWKAATRFCLR